jgi:hypothetical protein
MGELTASRKQRLRTLENEIRSGMEEFYYTGMKLKEIRDDELYKEDGFETWERYCRGRWEWDRNHVYRLITAAEYRQVMPTGHQEWSERSVRELTRIPDKKDAARVAKKIIEHVEKSKDGKLTSTVVRRFVDEDLGVVHSKTEPLPKENGIDLDTYLSNETGSLKGMREALMNINDDGWELLSRRNPQLMKRFITACDSLADVIRRFVE